MSASVFDKVECQLEIAVAAIVRVGYARCPGMLLEIAAHADYLCAPALRLGHRRDVSVVFLVHRDNMVEAIEVGRGVKLPCAVVEHVAASFSVPAHAGVGQVAHVPVAHSGRVYLEHPGKSAVVHQSLHHAVSGRRPADVAETNKEYSDFSFLGHEMVNGLVNISMAIGLQNYEILLTCNRISRIIVKTKVLKCVDNAVKP